MNTYTKIRLLLFFTVISISVTVRGEEPLLEQFSEQGRKVLNQTAEPEIKQGNWWEPDTVMIYRETSIDRFSYSYNETGLLSRKNFARKFLNENEWVVWEENQFVYDENRNLINRTCLKRGSAEENLANYSRLLFTYNNHNSVTNEMLQYWENGEWSTDIADSSNEPVYMKSYTYDETNRSLTELYQVRQNNDWTNNSIIRYIYASGSVAEEWQVWESNTMEWVNYKRYLYTFDERNNLLNETNQYWILNQWGNLNYSLTSFYTTLDEYTYDENNNLLTHSYKIWINEDWSNQSLIRNTYDLYGNLLTNTWLDWIENSWTESSIAAYTYNDHHNMVACTTSYRRNGIMTPERLTTKEYDAGDHCISTLVQRWNNESWENELYYGDTFDENGNCITGTSQRWKNNGWMDYETDMIFKYNNGGSTSGILSSCYRFEVSYINNPSKIDESLSDNLLIYPNPAENILNILFNNILTESAQIDIYDITGRCVQSKKLANSFSTLNVSSLRSGIYFYRIIYQGSVVARNKVVKQ